MEKVLTVWNQKEACDVTGDILSNTDMILCKDLDEAKRFSEELQQDMTGVSEIKFYSLAEIK